MFCMIVVDGLYVLYITVQHLYKLVGSVVMYSLLMLEAPV